MRKFIGYLFPWRQTFRRLQLEKYWWHRLAVVLFFVTLVPIFLYSGVIGDDAYYPENSVNENIKFWVISNDDPYQTPIPSGAVIGDGTGNMSARNTPKDKTATSPEHSPDIFDAVASTPATAQKTIEMPDGKVVTYSGTTSDETIKAEWKHKLNIATAKAAAIGFGIAILVAVVFSYLLQAGYRAVLYVIYGARIENEPIC